MLNNNNKHNNRNYGDASGRIGAGHAYQTANNSDSDKLNNNANDTMATNDKYTGGGGGRMNSDADADPTKAMHMANNVNKMHPSHQPPTVPGGYQPNDADAINERTHFNNLTGKLISTANSNYAPDATFITNDMAKVAICMDGRSTNAFANNHEDIVNYVVSGMSYGDILHFVDIAHWLPINMQLMPYFSSFFVCVIQLGKRP